AEEEQRNLLLEIANLPHESVPIGKDPSANRVVRSWGEKPRLNDPVDHVALGAKLKLFDLERAAKLSGSGFICFTDAGARLERALINFMIELHVREHGYIEVSPPFLVRRDCMIGTSQLPKFEADMYGLEGNQLFLAPVIWVSGQPRLTTSKCGRQARTHISKFRVARILRTSKLAGCTFDIKTLKEKIGFATR